MKLYSREFELLKTGLKVREYRLYDEKRKLISVGDTIEFSKLPELEEKIVVEVLDLYRDVSFNELFKKIFTDKEEIERKTESMLRFYTHEQEKEYGVVGIKIKLV